MLAVPARRNMPLRRRLNLFLIVHRAAVRVLSASNAAEREILGDYFLVDANKRHVVIRDHVDLYRLADEIGALRPAEKIDG